MRSGKEFKKRAVRELIQSFATFGRSRVRKDPGAARAKGDKFLGGAFCLVPIIEPLGIEIIGRLGY